MRRIILLAVLLVGGCRERRDTAADSLSSPPAPTEKLEKEWNDDVIEWKDWDEAKALSGKTKKPICLIFFTTWCPHCTNCAKVFHDERVVAAAKGFVMVRVNREKNEELSAEYAPDGEYIPRTYFLDEKARIRDDIRAQEGEYAWFFDENDPASLLGAMKLAAVR